MDASQRLRGVSRRAAKFRGYKRDCRHPECASLTLNQVAYVREGESRRVQRQVSRTHRTWTYIFCGDSIGDREFCMSCEFCMSYEYSERSRKERKINEK